MVQLRDGISKACDEVCGKKRGKRSKGDTLWWKEEMRQAVSRNKDAHKAMCRNSTGVNKRRYERGMWEEVGEEE